MPDKCATTGTCEKGTCVNNRCVKSILVTPGVECTSDDEQLGTFDTFSKCEAACIAKAKFANNKVVDGGCKYFIFGRPGTSKAGKCYWEKTASASCPPVHNATGTVLARRAPPGPATRLEVPTEV